MTPATQLPSSSPPEPTLQPANGPAPARALRQIEAWRRDDTFLRTAEEMGAHTLFLVDDLLIKDGKTLARVGRPNSRQRQRTRQAGGNV